MKVPEKRAITHQAAGLEEAIRVGCIGECLLAPHDITIYSNTVNDRSAAAQTHNKHNPKQHPTQQYYFRGRHNMFEALQDAK